jgi:PIN domain nuclease of toxin-antitoxin system
MTTSFVLDAWAILALLQKEEPASSRVLQLLQESDVRKNKLYVSIINLGEVYYRIGRVKGKKEADETLKSPEEMANAIFKEAASRTGLSGGGFLTFMGLGIRHLAPSLAIGS